MVGFITGTALLIILGQIDEFTGCTTGVEHNKVLAAIDILIHPSCWDIPTLVTGLSMIAMVLLFNKTPLRRIGLVMALVMTGVIVYAASWASVELVGDIAEIPRSFPVPMLPDFGAIDEVIIPALATAILGVAVAAGVSQNYPNPDGSLGKANKDFIGIGAANTAGGFFQSLPTTGSLSRTAVAVNAGAKSRMSNIFAGLIMVGVMFTIAPAAELIPMAGLAGLLIYVGYEAINQQKLRHAWHTSWPARIAMLTTCALCLIIELQYALFAGVFLSLVLFLYHQSTNVRIKQLVPLGGGRFEERKAPDRYPDNQVTALNFEGTSFFAAIQTIEQGLPSAEGVKNAAVILVGRGKDIPNNTFLTWVERYARDLQKSGNLLMLAEIQPSAKDVMITTGTVAAIGEENIFIAKGAVFASLEEAVAAAEKWVAKNKTGEGKT
jgi:SulP family sulfate permease